MNILINLIFKGNKLHLKMYGVNITEVCLIIWALNWIPFRDFSQYFTFTTFQTCSANTKFMPLPWFVDKTYVVCYAINSGAYYKIRNKTTCTYQLNVSWIQNSVCHLAVKPDGQLFLKEAGACAGLTLLFDTSGPYRESI